MGKSAIRHAANRTLRKKIFLFSGVLFSLLFSCGESSDFSNTPQGNFEALWTIMDQRYCYFDYKKIDWNEIHTQYASRIASDMNDQELFQILSEMLNELKDGHVNLYSAFDVSRYWAWFQDHPQNFNERLIDEYYLRFDYQLTSGIKYKVLPNNLGYMYYGSFSSVIGETNLDYILAAFAPCDGLIIDVRDNGGGMLSMVKRLVSRFINDPITGSYIVHKTGKGHNDFSDPYPIEIEPSVRIRYQKPIVILTNRSCFSATNNFVSIMKGLPNVTIVGDTTGGGSGFPFSSELPNGWSVRFSASPIYDRNMEHTEFGIPPDIFQNTGSANNRDDILERAFSVLLPTFSL